MSHFAHSAFVASFECPNVGHSLLDSNWVMPCMRDLKILKESGWVLALPPQDCHPILLAFAASKGFNFFKWTLRVLY
jgi:hypothetical protein